MFVRAKDIELQQNESRVGTTNSKTLFVARIESLRITHLRSGFVYKYDVSLAASDFEHFIRDVQVLLEEISHTSSLGQSLVCVNWGHIIGKNAVSKKLELQVSRFLCPLRKSFTSSLTLTHQFHALKLKTVIFTAILSLLESLRGTLN
jgi:hypothetical protein